MWQEKAEVRRWRESGFVFGRMNGQVTTLSCDDGAWLVGEAIDRINGCRQLQILELAGSDNDYKTLAGLETLPQLTRLGLCATRIGDAGMEQLGKFPALHQLDLCMTDVTDNCLVILAGLKSLTVVDLSQRRVSPEGIRWLKQSNPALQVKMTANDATLRKLSNRFRARQNTLLTDADSPSAPLGFRATGPQITDAGVGALRGNARVEELDPTGAIVTDAAFNDLAS